MWGHPPYPIRQKARLFFRYPSLALSFFLGIIVRPQPPSHHPAPFIAFRAGALIDTVWTQ